MQPLCPKAWGVALTSDLATPPRAPGGPTAGQLHRTAPARPRHGEDVPLGRRRPALRPHVPEVPIASLHRIDYFFFPCNKPKKTLKFTKKNLHSPECRLLSPALPEPVAQAGDDAGPAGGLHQSVDDLGGAGGKHRGPVCGRPGRREASASVPGRAAGTPAEPPVT